MGKVKKTEEGELLVRKNYTNVSLHTNDKSNANLLLN